jgi:hypothetical protein
MEEFRLLRADEIDCRVATVKKNGVSLLLYKDARCDMNILDETVGAERWQRKHELINGNLFCSVGIFCKDLNEWVWKQDVGTESYTEKEKGQASDAFKRACFNWGLGRELYTAPFIWINADDANISESNGKYTTYDRFEVKEIGYTDRKITRLVIENTKTGKIVYQTGKRTEKADPKWLKAIDAECKRTGAKREKVLAKMGINNPDELTLSAFNLIMKSFEKTPDGAYENDSKTD